MKTPKYTTNGKPVDVPPVITTVHHNLYNAFRYGGDAKSRGSWRIERILPLTTCAHDIHEAKIDRELNKVTLTCICGHTEVLWETVG